MITIAQHHVFQIAFVPFDPVKVIIEFRLLFFPHIKGFVDHDESHSIGQIEQFRSRRIM